MIAVLVKVSPFHNGYTIIEAEQRLSWIFKAGMLLIRIKTFGRLISNL